MYKCPIELITTDIMAQITKNQEEQVLRAVQGVGVNVDKKELEKALLYDRQQYNKGFEDGRNADKWISVKDRLPEEDGQYLIYTTIYFVPDHINECDHYDGMEISFYSTKYGFDSKNGLFAKYWMPLPEPPKEGADNG